MEDRTQTSFDPTIAEPQPPYGRMIDALSEAMNDHAAREKVREAMETYFRDQLRILRRANSARIEYEDGLKEELASERARLAEIDHQLAFLEKFVCEGGNSDEFKEGALYALKEIRRYTPRYEDAGE